ncbi:MAG: class I SAM-dependent methyltransferase [Chloroflexi bacterium]|nr:class I SAM-dependent methyltransferase [Chloroflexota bacterium]MBI3764422.1 class I SAM-dependent methyltransferase [Chloroflexota bacterium]
MRRLFFNLWYWLPVKPPWDSGISPPELTRVVEGSARSPALPPGRALDLGCGTGTNVIYLAQRGWHTVGVDFAGRAIHAARRKAKSAGADSLCEFHAGDVTDLSFLQPPFDLALDMGCFHSLDLAGRPRYADGLARLLRPGAIYLLYAFKPGGDGPRGASEEEVLATFQTAFRAAKIEQGTGRPSAWYTLERK